MRTTGSAPVFQVPRRGSPSARVWVTVLFCAFLPPIGLVLLWRGLRCPARGKVLISLIALFSMTVMLTAYFGFQRDNGTLIPQQSAGQFVVNDYTPSMNSTVTRNSANPTSAPTPAPAQPEMTPAPANPAG